MESEPSAHFGRVEWLLLWRGARFETRDVSSDLSQKCGSEVSTRSIAHAEVLLRSLRQQKSRRQKKGTLNGTLVNGNND